MSIKTNFLLIVRCFATSLAFILFSCEREITFDAVNVEQELVVSAFIQPGLVDSLLLTGTFCSLTSADFFEGHVRYKGVSGAKVVVLAKGDTVGRYVETKNRTYNYEGESFEENKEYQLEITHPDYPSVSAKTTVPVVPEFWFGTYADNGQMVKQYSKDDIMRMGAHIQVLLEFEDDIKTNNYYMITATSTHNVIFRDYLNHEIIDSIVTRTYPAVINSKSSIIEMIYHGTSYQFAQNSIDWESGYDVREYELYFRDKLFKGQKITIPIDINLWTSQNTTQVHLMLTAISEEYYQLLRSLAAYDKSENGFFPEALQLYGNVHNGHGMWAAKSSKTVSLDF